MQYTFMRISSHFWATNFHRFHEYENVCKGDFKMRKI